MSRSTKNGPQSPPPPLSFRASSIIQTQGNLILRITDYWNPLSFQQVVGLV